MAEVNTVTPRRHLEYEMTLDFFAGIPVTDYAAALPWYEQFFGGRPSFHLAGLPVEQDQTQRTHRGSEWDDSATSAAA